jgi:hypothetical protein
MARGIPGRVGAKNADIQTRAENCTITIPAAGLQIPVTLSATLCLLDRIDRQA